jgi:hypothetical protein
MDRCITFAISASGGTAMKDEPRLDTGRRELGKRGFRHGDGERRNLFTRQRLVAMTRMWRFARALITL